MSTAEKNVEELFFESGKGKYEVSKLAIDWIKVKKNEEGYKNLSQTQMLDKALRDVLTGEATYEKIAEIEKKKKAKQEEAVSAN